MRTLRYQDEEGLLRPAAVDDHTGYRWYSAGQLHRLNRILALGDLGLSLGELGQVIDEELSPAELRGTLRLRRPRHASAWRPRWAGSPGLEARLRRIEAEDRMGDHGGIFHPPGERPLSGRLT